MKKSRTIYFLKTKKDIQIDDDRTYQYAAPWGEDYSLPNYSYKVITDASILTVVYSVLISMREKNKNIILKKIKLGDGFSYSYITLKSNYEDYLDFGKVFAALLENNICEMELTK